MMKIRLQAFWLLSRALPIMQLTYLLFCVIACTAEERREVGIPSLSHCPCVCDLDSRRHKMLSRFAFRAGLWSNSGYF